MKPINDSVVELFNKSCYKPSTFKVELIFENHFDNFVVHSSSTI